MLRDEKGLRHIEQDLHLVSFPVCLWLLRTMESTSLFFSARRSALVMILLGINLLSRSSGKVREQQELSEHSKEAKLGVRPDPPLFYSLRLGSTVYLD